MNKLIIKSLLSNKFFGYNQKIYLGKLFIKYKKTSSISYYKRYCVITGNSKSIFQQFKMVRH